MTQKEDGNHEDLVEIFVYNFKRAQLHNIRFDTLETFYLELLGMSGLNLLT